MTETYTPAASPEDIVDDLDRPSDTLQQQADRILSEGRSYRPVNSVRAAVREDVSMGRDWLRDQRDAAVAKIEDKPVKATLYALGIGVLVGLLIAR
ncbi:MAG: hypothetical protein EON96_10930 [Caulobacteraceae bacterium]|nr:MAG: hypothetical protein EON96_10930 [Caulobacteraceae bacterium]